MDSTDLLRLKELYPIPSKEAIELIAKLNPEVSSEANVIIQAANTLITPTIEYGILVSDHSFNTDDKLAFAEILGLKLVRSSTRLKDYRGADHEVFLLRAREKGFKVAFNINWEGPAGNGQQPSSFPTSDNLKLYLERFRDVVTAFKDVFAFVSVENEPNNPNFYLQDDVNTVYYIEQVRQAII